MKSSIRSCLYQLACCFVVFLLATHLVNAQINVERFFPPYVEIGSTATIKAEGKFPSWPPKVMSDRDDLQLELGKESGQLIVHSQGIAHPGIAWIRLWDDTGAGALTPLVVGFAKVAVEAEPNDRLSQSTTALLPAAIVGRLEKNGDVDCCRIPLEAGQTLVASVTANRILGSPMDAALQLTDERGNVLQQSEDARGLDPRIVYTAQTSDFYFLRIFAFPAAPNSSITFAGGSSYVYVLEATVGPCLNAVLPLAFRMEQPPKAYQMLGWNLSNSGSVKSFVNQTQRTATLFAAAGLNWQDVPLVESATSILVDRTLSPVASAKRSSDPDDESSANLANATLATVPAIFSGVIANRQERDRFRCMVEREKKYRVEVQSQSLGFLADPAVTIFASDGKQLATNDDQSRNDYDASLEFTAQTDGPIEIDIRDATDGHSESHIYAARIYEAKPDFRLEITADQFHTKAGSTIEIPVTVTRISGMQEVIEISANNLPTGVTSVSVESQPKGDTAKKVTLKLDAVNSLPQHATFQIVGHAKVPDATDAMTQREAVYPLRDSYLASKIWLAITPKQN